MLAALAVSFYVEILHPSFIKWVQDNGAFVRRCTIYK
jgi:hypothetical protein